MKISLKYILAVVFVLSLGLLTQSVFATVGDVQLDVSNGGSITGTTVSMSKVVDSANAAYYLDPASGTTSLNVAGTVVAPTFSGALSGNATTATALAANGTNCSAGSFPLGVTAAGAVETCTTVASLAPGLTGTGASGSWGVDITGNAATATALAANGTNCSAGSFPLGVTAAGAVETCTTVASLAPGLTGTGASGTWSIGISGNAATATTATNQSGGSVSATTVVVDGVTRLDSSGNYTTLYDQSGSTALYLGGVGDAGNYYDNTVHHFRARAGTSETLKITSGSSVESFAPLYSEGANMQYRIYDTDVAKEWAISSFADTGVAFCEDSNGNTCRLMIAAGGKTGIGVNPDATYTLKVGGSTANTTGVWTNYSDQRLKHDIVPISNALATILQLKPVSFNWNDPKKDKELGRVRGFIAQDVEKVIPEWIMTDSTGYKAIQPIGMDAMLVGSVQDQQHQIESLQQTVKQQQEQIDTLKSQVNALINKE